MATREPAKKPLKAAVGSPGKVKGKGGAGATRPNDSVSGGSGSSGSGKPPKGGASPVHASTPPAPAVGVGNPKGFRDDARAILKDCEKRLETFREEVGESLEGHVNRTFGHVENALSDSWSVSDIVKDGVAMWINGYGTMRELYESAYRLYTPTPTDHGK